jgi:putative ABC transport system ATP-binding protein
LSEPLARCRDVEVAFGRGEARVQALVGVDLDVEAGERVALRGRSGSGKTTLLHVLGGLVEPSAGRVEWCGREARSLDEAARRRQAQPIAYVFQGSNLLPTLTAYENVAFASVSVAEQRDSSREPIRLLELVGLGKRVDNLPGELSGGEAQRVAIARALAQRPELLLCDEPTGQLDSDTGARVLDLIEALQREFGFALVTATHDDGVAARGQRVVQLEEGRVVAEEAA